MLHLQIYPSTYLRNICTPITNITDNYKKLAEEMWDIMQINYGVAIAGNQVGVTEQVFVAKNSDDKNVCSGKVYINPKIVGHSGRVERMEEGCLSLPGDSFRVFRWISVVVQYLDLSGTLQTEELCGVDAQVIQHEVDHLNGLLIIDRLPKHLLPKKYS